MAAIVLTTTENLPYEDWLAYRKKGIGGSDASVVCGVNRYRSPVELWMNKTGQLPDEEAGEAAYWGTQLEALVRAEFTKRTGIEVETVRQILQSADHPFMLANLDGVCEHPTLGPCIFEAKTASAYKSGEWESDAIPDEYVLQVQHYMAVTGYRGAYIAVLIGGNRFQWQFVGRDEDLISMLIRLESDFWNHVQREEPPSLDGSDASAAFLRSFFPDSVPSSVALVCNDDGKLLELPANRSLRDENGQIYDVVCGTFFLCGASVDSDRFSSLTPEQIGRYQERFHIPEMFWLVDGRIVCLPLEVNQADMEVDDES